jgi:hypothetical protein
MILLKKSVYVVAIIGIIFWLIFVFSSELIRNKKHKTMLNALVRASSIEWISDYEKAINTSDTQLIQWIKNPTKNYSLTKVADENKTYWSYRSFDYKIDKTGTLPYGYTFNSDGSILNQISKDRINDIKNLAENIKVNYPDWDYNPYDKMLRELKTEESAKKAAIERINK